MIIGILIELVTKVEGGVVVSAPGTLNFVTRYDGRY